MADEEIRIDYITTYITNKHGEFLRNSDLFNKKLRESAYVTKKGEGSIAAFRKEIERTSPEVAKITRELDRFDKAERRGVKLSEEQRRERTRLINLLKSYRGELRQVVKEHQEADREQARLAKKAADDLEASLRRQASAQTKADRERIKSMREAARAAEETSIKHRREIADLVARLNASGEAYDRDFRRASLWERKKRDVLERSTRRAISGVHEWTTTLASIALPAVPQILSLISGALGTIATAAVGAASSLAKLGPGIGAVGGAIAGVVQVTSVWKLAMRDMDKLISSAMFDNLADFTKKLKDFTPAAQEFAITMRGKVKPALTEWQKIAQGNIFGGINRGVNALLPRRGLITDIVRQTSAALGTGIGNFGQELASPEWAKAFKEIGSSNAQNIRTLTAAAIPLSRALRDIVVAGQPILDWAVQATAKTSKVFEQWIAGKKATGDLAKGVDGARKRLQDFIDIGASWGSTALSVLKAGQSTGDMITKGLRDNANAMQEWSKSFEGQRRMTEFFLNLQPAVKETGLLIKDLGASLARTAEQSSIEVLIHQLRADLLPTLEQVMIQTNQQMGPLLVDTVVNLLQALTLAMGPNGPVTLLINGINQVAQGFTKMTQIPVLNTLLKWTIGATAFFRVMRLTGVLVGGRVLQQFLTGRGQKQQFMADRLSTQLAIRNAAPIAFPEAMVQTRVPTGVGGRTVFGRKELDWTRLPPEFQGPFQPMPPTFMERLRSGTLREDFRNFRMQGAGVMRAGFNTFRPNLRGTGGGLIAGGALLGGLVAQQGAQQAGLSNRMQNIIGMGATGAGIGAAVGLPFGGVGAAIGAPIGAAVGGLAGLGLSFLQAKPKVDEFANSLEKATTGLAATRETVATMRQNQRQLQLGVRSGEIELRQAIKARDALTRGMTDREFQKFQRTDVFKEAQLRVDAARTNLQDMRNALDKNTEQLRIANDRLKSDQQRPRNVIQNLAGEAGGRLSEINARIRVLRGRDREGRGGAADAAELQRLIKDRAKIIREFSGQMLQASRRAAENGLPFWSRMFANAAAKAMTDGRIGANFTATVNRATRRGIVFPSAGSRANTASHDIPGDFAGRRRAGGGRITWGSPTSDTAPAMLSRGEFVVTGGGEQMLESMTFPGVLNWLEGSQPPHFMRGGRVRGAGDMVDRRHNDPWKTRGSVGPWLPDSFLPEAPGSGVSGIPFHDFVARAAMRSDKPFKVVKFPENSPLGRLQRAMGVHNFRRGGRFQDGGFFRRGILSQFQGSFSSGFSAGASKTPDAIAGLLASTISSGTFAAEQATGGGGGKGKGKDFSGNLAKAGAKVRGLYGQVKDLLASRVPYVPGGGHATAPGPSKPDPRTLVAEGVVGSLEAAKKYVQLPDVKSGLDHSGFVRMALARSGFGDPGQRPQNLLGWGRQGLGKWLTVYALPPSANRAYLNVAGTEFGYYGRDPNFTLGSHARTSRGSQGFSAMHWGSLRRGGRVGRRFQTGGRVTMPNLNPRVGGAIAMPGLTGRGGDAANKQWAASVAGYLGSLTTASIGNITNAINSLGSQVVSMTANADSSPAAQNLLARVSALLDAAEFALGERLGRAQAAIEDMATQTALRRTRLDRFERQREIDPGSRRGLGMELGQLRFENFGRFGLQAQIRAQRGLVAAAAGTQEEQQLRDRLTELIAQAADNAVDRVVTRRAIARARDQLPIDRLGTKLDVRNFDLQRLTLRQQIAGTADTTGGNAALDKFLKTQILPAQIAREKAANRAMVRERQRSGRDSEAFRAAQEQWQQAVLDRLGTQVSLAEKNNDQNSEISRKLGGQLSFDFMGQGFTDAITSGVGV